MIVGVFGARISFAATLFAKSKKKIKLPRQLEKQAFRAKREKKTLDSSRPQAGPSEARNPSRTKARKSRTSSSSRSEEVCEKRERSLPRGFLGVFDIL